MRHWKRQWAGDLPPLDYVLGTLYPVLQERILHCAKTGTPKLADFCDAHDLHYLEQDLIGKLHTLRRAYLTANAAGWKPGDPAPDGFVQCLPALTRTALRLPRKTLAERGRLPRSP